MKPEEKVPYLKTLLFIALADDTVEDGELKYFEKLAEIYGLSATEVADIKECVLNKKESLVSIVEGITERSTKLTLLYELLALCYADNNYSLAEKTSMKDVCNILDIETEKLSELENVMEENVALQKKIDRILERG